MLSYLRKLTHVPEGQYPQSIFEIINLNTKEERTEGGI